MARHWHPLVPKHSPHYILAHILRVYPCGNANTHTHGDSEAVLISTVLWLAAHTQHQGKVGETLPNPKLLPNRALVGLLPAP